jgi:phage repressor protein C with HTH and peptisase S24 domain
MRSIEDIIKIIKNKGFTAYEVAKQTSLTEAGLLKIFSGESKNPRKSTVEILNNFVNNQLYPTNELNNIAKEPEAIWVKHERFMLVPMVNHRAQAGFLSGWGDDEYLEELPKIPWEVDKEYKGKYMTFEVSGESMESEEDPRDSLYEGDLLLCREVMRQHWQNKLHINKWDFVIVHREKGILAKRITHHDTNNGIITLHSLNPYYEDQKVSLDDLIAIFNIIDVKRSRKRR